MMRSIPGNDPYDNVSQSNRNRLLIFADWFEPGVRGGGLIRSCVNVAQMLKNTHEVYVFSRNHDFGVKEVYNGIISDSWVDFEEDIKIYYCSDKNLKPSTIKNVIEDIGPNFIYLNSMYSYYFTLIPLCLLHLNRIEVEKVLAPRGMLHPGALKIKYLKKKLFIWLINKIGLLKGVTIHASSTYEEYDIDKHLKNVHRIHIPDLPDVERYLCTTTAKQPGHLKCLFLSRIAKKKNLHYLLTHLCALKTEIELTIAGGIDDLAYWNSCLAVIEQLPSHITVVYKGIIPHNETPILIANSHLLVLPTFGENFGHVIFESMIHGTPVLISDQTPWSELQEKQAGWEIPLSNQQEFMDTIEFVGNMDQKEYLKWSIGAHRYGHEYLRNANHLKGYLKLFKTQKEVRNIIPSEESNFALQPALVNE